MKITKSELKNIVKECLVEILNEGLGSGLGAGGLTPAVPRQSSFKSQMTAPISDNVKRQPLPRPTSNLREAIKREAGGDKVLEAILADTAASTLPTFLQNEGKTPVPASVGGGLVEQVVARANPEDLFGDDVTSKWASLAFMESPIKK